MARQVTFKLGNDGFLRARTTEETICYGGLVNTFGFPKDARERRLGARFTVRVERPSPHVLLRTGSWALLIRYQRNLYEAGRNSWQYALADAGESFFNTTTWSVKSCPDWVCELADPVRAGRFTAAVWLVCTPVTTMPVPRGEVKDGGA